MRMYWWDVTTESGIWPVMARSPGIARKIVFDFTGERPTRSPKCQGVVPYEDQQFWKRTCLQLRRL